MPRTIAAIAHDAKKDDMVNFAIRHKPLLSRYHLIATQKTGKRIQDAIALKIELMESGTLGGYAQIAAKIVAGEIIAVIFLIDPINDRYEPDIQALLRICNVYLVPLATNLGTAEAIANSFAQSLVAHLIFNPVSGNGNGKQDLEFVRQTLEPHLHLGIIPRGTANAFSMALGITQQIGQLRRACEIILAGKKRIVDAAKCNDLPLILLAGIGYEAGAIEKADREAKNRWGTLAYLMAGWQQLDEQQLFEAEIEIEGKTKTFQAGAITIANAAPPTSVLAQGIGEVVVDDGLLDITIATVDNKLQAVTTILSMLGAALIRTSAGLDNIVHLRSPKVKIAANPSQKVVLDGEIIGNTPLEIECLPKSLTVFVPNFENREEPK